MKWILEIERGIQRGFIVIGAQSAYINRACLFLHKSLAHFLLALEAPPSRVCRLVLGVASGEGGLGEREVVPRARPVAALLVNERDRVVRGGEVGVRLQARRVGRRALGGVVGAARREGRRARAARARGTRAAPSSARASKIA